MNDSDGSALDEDAAFTDRLRRWKERYDDACVFAPVPMWWPWPLEVVAVDDGDPDTGLVVIGLEPFLWPGETSEETGRPYAKLVRQRIGEPRYSYGWPGLAGLTPEDDDEPVSAYAWQDDRWRWTVFVSGNRRLDDAELARIRTSLDPDHQFPQGVSSFRPWS